MFTELPLKLKYFNSCRFLSVVKAGGIQDPTSRMLTTIFFCCREIYDNVDRHHNLFLYPDEC